jgi:predicted nuclease of predicted toxin-antitoxin system
LKLLIDNSLSWRIARDLRRAGHDTVHIADLGLAAADDKVVYGRAVLESRSIITQDSDFGPVHTTSDSRIGVVLLRLSDGRPRSQAEVLVANLPELEQSLLEAAFVVVDDERIVVQPRITDIP